jgi:hypothetical protein
MSERIYRDLLNLNEASFRKVISNLVKSNKKNAEIELVRKHTNIDKTLFFAIDMILKSLKREESFLNIFLYRYFSINLSKNKKFKQLDIFNLELNKNLSKLNRDKSRVDLALKQLNRSLKGLERFKENILFELDKIKEQKYLNRLNHYLKRVDIYIKELGDYKKLLESKYQLLVKIENEYKGVKKEIARYRREV